MAQRQHTSLCIWCKYHLIVSFAYFTTVKQNSFYFVDDKVKCILGMDMVLSLLAFHLSLFSVHILILWCRRCLIWLTYSDWVTHICFSKLTIIGSDNRLSPGRWQAIIWTIAGILLIWPEGTTFSAILIKNAYIVIIENIFDKVVCKLQMHTNACTLSKPWCNLLYQFLYVGKELAFGLL